MRTLHSAREEATSESSAPRTDLAWREVVLLVHRQMRSIVGPAREIDDLTQNALEQVVRSVSRFEGRAELATYTYRICAHVALNHWRSWTRWLRRFQLGVAPTDPEPADSTSTADAVLEQERLRHLRAALDRLSPNKRIVVTLADLEELPASKIAEILECPEPTVRSRLRQARIELVAFLEQDPLFGGTK